VGYQKRKLSSSGIFVGLFIDINIGVDKMYQVGDYIIFGNKGICKIENIGALDMADMPKSKVFYTLIPCFTKESKIFTPVDNDKVIMRQIISKEEAFELINDIRNIDSLWVTDEKRRETEYKEVLKKCDCRELVRIIKTIYMRMQSRIVEGKKVTSLDTKYFKIAEDNLYGELSITLSMDVNAVKEFVISRVDQSNINK
jgi:CarD family transcriptional regulator